MVGAVGRAVNQGLAEWGQADMLMQLMVTMALLHLNSISAGMLLGESAQSVK